MAKKAKIEALLLEHEQYIETLRAVEIVADIHHQENETYKNAIVMKVAEIAKLKSAMGKNECDVSPQQTNQKKC